MADGGYGSKPSSELKINKSCTPEKCTYSLIGRILTVFFSEPGGYRRRLEGQEVEPYEHPPDRGKKSQNVWVGL